MRFGCMTGWRGDLRDEIRFAKKHFDFIELTLIPARLRRKSSYFASIKKELNGAEVLGHLHWDVKKLSEIYRNIMILKRFGAKKMTIHPFTDPKMSLQHNIEYNIKILSKINAFCKKNGIQLLIENVSGAPFDRFANIAKIINKIPNICVTLDVGHANKTAKGELNLFLKKFGPKIKHVHLHDNAAKKDHLFFDDASRIKKTIVKLTSAGYTGTVTLETFSVMKKNKHLSLEFPELKKEHLRQLKLLKNVLY
jgi:sugar phosphate isomerase/epimerase